jgi:hypothetical protein
MRPVLGCSSFVPAESAVPEDGCRIFSEIVVSASETVGNRTESQLQFLCANFSVLLKDEKSREEMRREEKRREEKRREERRGEEKRREETGREEKRREEKRREETAEKNVWNRDTEINRRL